MTQEIKKHLEKITKAQGELSTIIVDKNFTISVYDLKEGNDTNHVGDFSIHFEGELEDLFQNLCLDGRKWIQKKGTRIHNLIENGETPDIEVYAIDQYDRLRYFDVLMYGPLQYFDVLMYGVHVR